MTADELTAPLGQTPRKRGRKFLVPIPHVVAGAFALFLGIFVLWAIAGDDPFGGEPRATAPVDLRAATAAKQPETPAAPESAPNPQTPPRYKGSASGSAAPEKNSPASAPPSLSTSLPASLPPSPPPNTKTITIIDGKTGARREVVIPVPSGAAVVPAEQKPPTARALPTASPGR